MACFKVCSPTKLCPLCAFPSTPKNVKTIRTFQSIPCIQCHFCWYTLLFLFDVLHTDDKLYKKKNHFHWKMFQFCRDGTQSLLDDPAEYCHILGAIRIPCGMFHRPDNSEQFRLNLQLCTGFYHKLFHCYLAV